METVDISNLRELINSIREIYSNFIIGVMKKAKDIRDKGLIWTLFKIQSNNQKVNMDYLGID